MRELDAKLCVGNGGRREDGMLAAESDNLDRCAGCGRDLRRWDDPERCRGCAERLSYRRAWYALALIVASSVTVFLLGSLLR